MKPFNMNFLNFIANFGKIKSDWLRSQLPKEKSKWKKIKLRKKHKVKLFLPHSSRWYMAPENEIEEEDQNELPDELILIVLQSCHESTVQRLHIYL